jgi:hypothetical protein
MLEEFHVIGVRSGSLAPFPSRLILFRGILHILWLDQRIGYADLFALVDSSVFPEREQEHSCYGGLQNADSVAKRALS